MSSIVESLTQIVLNCQTELFVFAFAVIAHWAVFGKRHWLEELKHLPKIQKVTSVRSPKHLKAQADGNAAFAELARSGDVAGVERSFSELKRTGQADLSTFNIRLRFCTQRSEWKKALEVMMAMRSAGFTPSVSTFNDMFKTMQDRGGEVWPMVEEMRRAGVKPNRVTCSILLKTPNARNVVEKVLPLIGAMEEEIDDILLGSLIDNCIREEQRDVLSRLLHDHLEKDKREPQMWQSYGWLIRAYGYLKNIDKVWSSWHHLRTQHSDLSCVIVGSMVQALVVNGDTDGAHNLLRELLLDPQTKPLVNVISFGSILKGYAHQKRFHSAWSVYEDIKEHNMELSIVTYNTVIDACARNGEMRKVPEVLAAMEAQGIQPTVVTFSALVKGYCQEGQIEQAFQVMETMSGNMRLQPDEQVYNTLIGGCALSHDYARGFDVFQKMLKAGIKPTNFTLSVLVKLLGRCGKLDEAFEVCEDVALKYGLRLNVHVYSNLIQACLQGQRLDRGMRVLETMVEKSVRPEGRSYALLLSACVQAGLKDEVEGLLSAALGRRETVSARLRRFPLSLLKPTDCLKPDVMRDVLQFLRKRTGDEALTNELSGVVESQSSSKFGRSS